MKDFIQHATNVQNVLWYMDSMETLSDGTIIFSGWIAHPTQPVVSLVIGNQPLMSMGIFDRPDVKQVYPNLPTAQVGVKVRLHKDHLTLPVSLILQNGETVYSIGTFQRWAAFYSGFKPVQKKGIVIVDDFYADPDFVREFAMKNLTFAGSDYHRGKRSEERFILNGTKETFEEILGKKIINWNHPSYANGKFQYCTSTDPIVYHVDTQTYAAMVYLTPDAPLNTGTATYRSKITGATRFDSYEGNEELYIKTFKGRSNDMNFYDNTTYELVDSMANVYNRLVLFDSKTIHAATGYFGDAIENARFFHLFFFDVEW
jgi:hypothetical protein